MKYKKRTDQKIGESLPMNGQDRTNKLLRSTKVNQSEPNIDELDRPHTTTPPMVIDTAGEKKNNNVLQVVHASLSRQLINFFFI